MIKDLIAAILVAILIDVSWNAAGMRDPLPEPPPERAPIIVQSSQPTYSMTLPMQAGTAGAVLQSTTTGITWIVSGPDPSKLYCLTVDGADNVVNADGVCPGASQ